MSDEARTGEVADHIAYSYYIGGAILLATVLVTSFKTKEYPPKEFAEYNGIPQEQAAERPSFVSLIRDIPRVMLQLGVVQFFSWAALS